MKKFLYTLMFSILFASYSFAQDPGFGGEGDGDAQTSPTDVPIDQNLGIVLIMGVFLGGYFLSKNRKTLSKNN